MKESTGLIQLFTGNGRGKTSAALGTVLRAVGQGLKVHVIHFMKGSYPYGEHRALAHLPNVTVERFGRLEFVDRENVLEEDRAEARKALEASRRAVSSGEYDLVVLDEINIASAWGLVGVEEVLEVLREKHPGVEVILTGRYADERLVAAADLVTEMVEVKHPYSRGIKARRGLEY